jgi:hypothetical protein
MESCIARCGYATTPDVAFVFSGLQRHVVIAVVSALALFGHQCYRC